MDAGLGVRVALHADGLARTFAGACVRLGALTANREAAQVPNATIALDTLEALQIHTDLAAKIAFGHILSVLDRVDNLRELGFTQILGANGAINACALEDLLGIHRTDSVNITKRDIDALLSRNVHT